jgi:hypothetical protein
MINDHKDVGVDAGARVPIAPQSNPPVVSVESQFRLAGVDWDYYNVITHILQYTYNQPDGYVGHLGWQGDGEWRVMNLWQSDSLRDRFFIEFGLERLSKGINLLGAVKGPEGVTDVKPIQCSVEQFVFGPRARAFVDIGEDRDGSAIAALGGAPIALEIEVNGMRADEYQQLYKRLGYDTSVPAELISHHAVIEDDGMRIFETWSGSGHALVTLGGALLPAVEQLGEQLGREFLCFHLEYPLQRIALNAKAVAAFGF